MIFELILINPRIETLFIQNYTMKNLLRNYSATSRDN